MAATVISIVISVLALVVSIIVAITTSIREKRIKKRDLNDKIFLEVYLVYMIKEIPEAIAKVRIIGDGELSGAKEYAEVLRSAKLKSIYYRYSDNSFYTAITNKFSELEDYLVKNLNGKHTGDAQQKVLSDIQNKTQEIYSLLNTQRMKL